MLVLRLVDHCDANYWHICPARAEFTEGAIVTLQALCGTWAFGSLTRMGLDQHRTSNPTAMLCHYCLALFHAEREQEW